MRRFSGCESISTNRKAHALASRLEPDRCGAVHLHAAFWNDAAQHALDTGALDELPA